MPNQASADETEFEPSASKRVFPDTRGGNHDGTTWKVQHLFTFWSSLSEIRVGKPLIQMDEYDCLILSHQRTDSKKEVVDAVGIEPTTSRLRVECSTS
jgi:hypothetical protein